MLGYCKKHKIVVATAMLIIVASGVVYFGGDRAPKYEIVKAELRDVVQEVAVVGRVKPSNSVDLAFEKGGKVAQVYVSVGERVSRGELLIALGSSDARAKLAQSDAAVETAEAGLVELKAILVRDRALLAELRKGTRPEEIVLEQVKVSNAKSALQDDIRNLADAINDAYTKSDDAVRNKTDQLFDDPRTGSPRLKSSVFAGSQAKSAIEWSRLTLESTLNSWGEAISTIDPSTSDMVSYLASADANLLAVSAFLDKLSSIVNSQSPGAGLSQTTIDSWRSDVSVARTGVNTAKANLTTANDSVASAKNALALAEQQLRIKQAGATEEQIAAQVAKVQEDEAKIVSQMARIKESQALSLERRVALNQTSIHSPMAGVVSYRQINSGEIVSAGVRVVSVISEAMYEIEADISEADVGKVLSGNIARVTLDAYGYDTVFGATVVSIDPAETIVNGVATYKATLFFNEDDSRVRSGMSASITIETNRQSGVVALPLRALIRRSGEWIVRKVEGDSVIDIVVTSGIRGSDGYVEIIEGVDEGTSIAIGDNEGF